MNRKSCKTYDHYLHFISLSTCSRAHMHIVRIIIIKPAAFNDTHNHSKLNTQLSQVQKINTVINRYFLFSILQ